MKTVASWGIIMTMFISIQFFNLPSATAEKITFIESNFLHKVMFPYINLSGMTGRNPISQDVIENWKERMQVEGVGIACALFDHLTRIKALVEGKARILIVGSPAGNSLGLLSAALILAKLNITSDFYIVKQEYNPGNAPDAFKHACEIIDYIRKNPIPLEGKLNILNESDDPLTESDDSAILKAKKLQFVDEITKNPKSENTKNAVKDLVELAGKTRFSESKVENKIKDDIKKLVYAVVLDCICGNSMKEEVKLNVIPAIRILNTAQSVPIKNTTMGKDNEKTVKVTNENLVVSNDMPSLSGVDGSFTLPKSYEYLAAALKIKLDPIIPKVILNMGAIKLHFSANADSLAIYKQMTHYIITPWALENALRQDGHIYMFNFNRSMYKDKIVEIEGMMDVYKIVVPELNSSRTQNYLEFGYYYYRFLDIEKFAAKNIINV